MYPVKEKITSKSLDPELAEGKGPRGQKEGTMRHREIGVAL